MAKPFKQIAIVGTGTLGVQIGLMAANAGYRVNVWGKPHRRKQFWPPTVHRFRYLNWNRAAAAPSAV